MVEVVVKLGSIAGISNGSDFLRGVIPQLERYYNNLKK